jgi:molybdate transport system ATP-binding protein
LEILLKIENATIKYRNQVLFEGLNFEIKKDEHWAIVGESGSGKSAFLHVLAGRSFVLNGIITHAYFDAYMKEHPVSDPLASYRSLIAYVDIKHDFKNLSNTAEFYYQQRFNAGYSDNSPTVEDYLRDTASAVNPGMTWTLNNVYDTFNLEPLRHQHLIKLSNGESKRLRVGAALLKNPLLLLLDNPLTGLDVSTREQFEDIFSRIVQSGIAIVMVTNPYDIPKIITHVAALSKNRRLKVCKRQVFEPGTRVRTSQGISDADKLKKIMARGNKQSFDVLVSMRNVRVTYGDSVIFDNINWEIRPGDCWALSGPNGSGKSTLLSLINGDHPQAYANDIVLFDKKRGSGESIWDIKKRIGFMSPELFQYFPYHFTCLQVVESGFYDTIGLLRQSQQQNRQIAEKWMSLMGLFSVRENRLSEIPASQQRMCLLARALVKIPYLLMLDEPCLGFDQSQQQAFKRLIDAMAKLSDLAIIYVTHHKETLPDSITKTLTLG